VDKNLIGKTSKPYEIKVEAERIKTFTKAIGDLNQIFNDNFHSGVLYTPLTFPTTFGFAFDLLENLNIDYLNLLHGEQEYEYFRPIKAGNELICQSRVTDIYEKKGQTGTIDFIVLETETKDKNTDKLVVISRTTLLIRRI